MREENNAASADSNVAELGFIGGSRLSRIPGLYRQQTRLNLAVNADNLHTEAIVVLPWSCPGFAAEPVSVPGGRTVDAWLSHRFESYQRVRHFIRPTP